MRKLFLALAFTGTALAQAPAVPANLVAENLPPIPSSLKEATNPYMEFRSAGFNSWHPQRREMLITTRFGNVPQIHLVKMPGGDRKQLTFFEDRVGGGSFRPKSGESIVFAKDIGGGEFFQLYRYDVANGRVTLLTDGKSRNGGASWSEDGKWIAYTSTRRNGKDTDIYLMSPDDKSTDKMLLQREGGGWGISDWSQDASQLLMMEYVSANESYIHLVDVKTGATRLLTPKGTDKVARGGAEFSKDGKSILFTTDDGREFQTLVRMDLASSKITPITSGINWDVEGFDLSQDGKKLAFLTNEAGIGLLHVLDLATGKKIKLPKLPSGTIGGVEWHNNNRDLGFTLSSAKSPADAYSIDITSGKVERWTESETGGLNTAMNVEPELIKWKSFDGVEISAFVYRPDASKFPGKRPSIINIHGGPEGQSQPGFLGRSNYLLNEMGIAIIYPNVRGSSGYGKTFLAMDNGFKREDSVKDIGTLIDWINKDSKLDSARIGVTGGSYGGYMTLAVMTHYSDRLRAGLDVVGISNFVTFLKNTQDYRRDLRRVEYGDEREAKMREHLEAISPLTNASKIKKPLFVVQGFNDPRVPYTEAEQIAKAVRGNNVPVWYLMAKDEGHGFAKKSNADFQFLASIMFWQEHLLN